MEELFNGLLVIMTILGAIVFIALYYVEAGYGMLFDNKWGIAIPNRIAWVCMEVPVFFIMMGFWYFSDRRFELVPFLFFLFFEIHYFQRSFIFPLLIKGKSRMPISIMAMGVVFNMINGFIQGEWIFYLSPADMYNSAWLLTPQFIIGTMLFLGGMIVNLHSDYIIRHLRKRGDTAHYLPKGAMFNYVTSANYFGEIVEWIGFAVLTWSWSGAVFAWWTFANLVPRANAIYKKYGCEFGEDAKKLKRVIPFIY